MQHAHYQTASKNAEYDVTWLQFSDEVNEHNSTPDCFMVLLRHVIKNDSSIITAD